VRPLDGHSELAVAEAAAAAGSRPSRVTAVIAAVYTRLDDQPVDAAIARRVSAAGREWLLQRAAQHFSGGAEWFETECVACGGRFDLSVSMRDIPCLAAGDGFPCVDVLTSLGRRRFEVPNGTHEEVVARRADEDPRRVFAAVCGLADSADADAWHFDSDDLDRIDAALESVSPDVADTVTATCPECGTSRVLRLDPLTFAFPRPDEVLQDVHLLASGYRWSERSILDLPIDRRRAYSERIRADRVAERRAGSV
jgi:hypothetical protein